jgi:hypothetical protein
MYNFPTELRRVAYRTAIDSDAIQHIRGTLKLASGTEIDIAAGDHIDGTPRIDQKCVESDDTFMFGQMYVGTLDIILNNIAYGSSGAFRGAQITLDFGVETGDDTVEWVPLGVWDVTSVDKLIGDHKWQIKAADRLNRLRAAINDNTVGIIKLPAIIDSIKQIANVEFQQTVDQIAALIGRPASNIRCVEFSSTCWEEVRQIAQLMGGFAFANRSGKIEFRKFRTASGSSPVLTIPADHRHSFKPSEGVYKVDSVSYTDSKGHTYTSPSQNGTVQIGFSNNKYIFTGSENFTDYYSEWIDPIAEHFAQGWYTGTCDYRGDPALDLGDMIALTDGLADESTLPMLITGISWGFRARQNITSAGLPDTGSGASSSGSGASYSGSTSQTAVTSVLRTVPLETFPDTFDGKYTAASGGFGARQSIDGFVNIGIICTASAAGVIKAKVLLDEISQVLQPAVSAQSGDTVTLSAMVPISPEAGSHTVRVELSGSCEITEISAAVVGQDIAPETPEITTESDYTYTVSNGAATVTGYIGTAAKIRIPDTLGGAATTVIGAESFTGTDVVSAVIPEGVTEIE